MVDRTLLGLCLTVAVLGPDISLAEETAFEEAPFDTDSPPAADPRHSASLGIGLNTSLAPDLVANSRLTAVSLRLWLSQLMVEPLLGFRLVTGDVDTRFGLGAGALLGFALARGNLRPIIGGGMVLALSTGDGTNTAFSLGPLFGLEYRFDDFPSLAFDASIFLPIQISNEPFTFSMGTGGGALVGFHYYFSM